MDTSLETRFDRIDEALALLAMGLQIVAGTQRAHGERLDKIVAMLSPKDGDGPSVKDVLSQILDRLDALARHSRAMAETLSEMAHGAPGRG